MPYDQATPPFQNCKLKPGKLRVGYISKHVAHLCALHKLATGGNIWNWQGDTGEASSISINRPVSKNHKIVQFRCLIAAAQNASHLFNTKAQEALEELISGKQCLHGRTAFANEPMWTQPFLWYTQLEGLQKSSWSHNSSLSLSPFLASAIVSKKEGMVLRLHAYITPARKPQPSSSRTTTATAAIRSQNMGVKADRKKQEERTGWGYIFGSVTWALAWKG